MVIIRLSRGGAKKRPFYEVIVTDRRRATSGQCIERIGFYNPLASSTEEALRLDMERYNHWLSKGAKASDRVLDLVSAKAKTAA
jgi:small subunit ribosomal protein S16